MAPIPRSEIAVGVDAGLRGRLGGVVRDGVVVLDYFTSRRCNVTIGDLTAAVRQVELGPAFAELAPIEGVRIFAERRLLPVLRIAGPGLRLTRGPFGGRLSVTLDRPELWLDFLENPGLLRRLAGERAPIEGAGANR
jgi:hypothetical protein